MAETVSSAEKLGWTATLAVLVLFAVPWFLWGANRIVLGLPIWLWWHIGWMCLAAGLFWLFTVRAWGIWITDSEPTGPTTEGQK